MNELIASSATIGVVISLIGYGLGILIRDKFKKDFCNPLLISIVFCILFLKVAGVQFETFNESAKYLAYLLNPATVALAVPLYIQIERLKKNIVAILCGITAGCLTSMGGVLILCWLMKLDHATYVTMLPKSITTAIGMSVSGELGGYVAITVAVILVTGLLGNMSAEFVLKLFHITDPIAKGLAIGTCSHAMGTSKAMEIGEIEGAMSSLSIVVAGILTVIGANVFAGIM